MSREGGLNGGEGYRLVWATVKRIPPGRVATYGQIAEVAGLGRQARLVGYALHRTPDGRSIPWHRVLNASGRISVPGPTAALQRALLEKEGVAFSDAGRVSLARFRWRPRTKTRA